MYDYRAFRTSDSDMVRTDLIPLPQRSLALFLSGLVRGEEDANSA